MKIEEESVQLIKKRRDAVLEEFINDIPYLQFMGISFERRGNELTSILTYSPKLIGNPIVQRLHGGGTAGFLESTALITLAWKSIWTAMEDKTLDIQDISRNDLPDLPKTIDFTTDYLRPGLARDAYARATINRSGRRYASVHVEAWQDRREVIFAQATGHFLMPKD